MAAPIRVWTTARFPSIETAPSHSVTQGKAIQMIWSAVEYTLDHFPYGGTKMLVMVTIARKCQQRRSPWCCKLSIRAIAKACRLSKRHTENVLQELIALGHLHVVQERGRTASLTLQVHPGTVQANGDSSVQVELDSPTEVGPRKHPRARPLYLPEDLPSSTVQEPSNVIPIRKQA